MKHLTNETNQMYMHDYDETTTEIWKWVCRRTL